MPAKKRGNKSSARGTRRPVKKPARRSPLIPVAARIPILVIGVALLLFASAGTAYGLHLENNDAFCASCHTQPETQFYQQSLQKDAVTLAAFHTPKSTRCIDCHSGSGPLGRVVGLVQGGQDLTNYLLRHYHNPAITTNKIGDNTCLKCHQQVTVDQTFQNHFHAFLSRWQAADPSAATCVDCHTGHVQGDPATGYLQAPSVDPLCQKCHQVLGGG